jgi:hypothetical protein
MTPSGFPNQRFRVEATIRRFASREGQLLTINQVLLALLEDVREGAKQRGTGHPPGGRYQADRVAEGGRKRQAQLNQHVGEKVRKIEIGRVSEPESRQVGA